MKIRRVLSAVVLLTLLPALCGCSSARVMKIQNVNAEANTFDFVDQQTGKAIEYDTLIMNGKPVVEYACSTGMGEMVMFAYEEGQIVRSGNKTTYNNVDGYTAAAELEYKLEGGTLTVLGLKD